MKNLGIIIGVIIGVSAAVLILVIVMNAQDNMDRAGINFTKMNDGLLLSSIHSDSPKMTVTEMAHTCAEKLRESGVEPDPTPVTECVRTMLKELNK